MTPSQLPELVFRPAFSLLDMDSPEARAMLIAIGMQESRFQYRRQVRGPARGFWQFESGGGVRGVMTHHASREHAARIVGVLCYPQNHSIIHAALADNDILACCFARLLLYTDPDPLPALDADPDESWDYYWRNWRPGKPHPETWGRFWSAATTEVQS